jgi:hypothetical protein
MTRSTGAHAGGVEPGAIGSSRPRRSTYARAVHHTSVTVGSASGGSNGPRPATSCINVQQRAEPLQRAGCSSRSSSTDVAGRAPGGGESPAPSAISRRWTR